MRLFIVILTLILVACQKNDVGIDEATVDPILEPYFNSFAREGYDRGIDVDFDFVEVSGIFSDLSEAKVTAQCQHDPNFPDRVVIDQTYWNQATDLDREFLVFHELGHCYLKRSHMDLQNSNGTCVSIMHSSASVCKNIYRQATRATYLDELFSN